MKLLHSSPDTAEIGLLRSQLESANIACEVRNDYLTSALPGAPFYPELWVLNDDDFADATELVDALRNEPQSKPKTES
jgi:hypothetical protein